MPHHVIRFEDVKNPHHLTSLLKPHNKPDSIGFRRLTATPPDPLEPCLLHILLPRRLGGHRMRSAILETPTAFEEADRDVKTEYVVCHFYEGHDAFIPQHLMDVGE